MKHEDGVDEMIQHFYWTIYRIFVSLDQIRKGPDPLLTSAGAKANAYFAVPSIPPASIRKESPNANERA